MKRREVLTGMVCWLALAAAPAIAEEKLINDPSAGWVVYGQQTNKRVKDKDVQGGYAIEVKTTKGGNPWDTAAHTEITGDIKKGDKILAALWMRSVTEDGAPARINVRIQVNAAPYDGVAERTQTVGPGWQLYHVETVAKQDYAKKTTVVTVHLGAAKQTVYLGPAFVLNSGQ